MKYLFDLANYTTDKFETIQRFLEISEGVEQSIIIRVYWVELLDVAQDLTHARRRFTYGFRISQKNQKCTK